MRKTYSLLVLALALFLSACGSNNNTTTQNNNLTTLLKSQSFYSVEENDKTRNIFKISFDENLSTWEIQSYDTNFTTPLPNPTTNKITITKSSIINSGAVTYNLAQSSEKSLDFTTLVNSLVSLKLFYTQGDAQKYYDKTLKNSLQAKEFFVVQNDLLKRSLLKIKIAPDATQWDVTVYDTNFTNPKSAAYALAITINDQNLTDSGGAKFYFNTTTPEYIKLVSITNNYVTLRFYKSAEAALTYFNSNDLRVELKNKTFYAVSKQDTKKTLYTFKINENLNVWTFSLYPNGYDNIKTTQGNSTIIVLEDRLIEDKADTLFFNKKTADYIELQSISNAKSLFKLYNLQVNAEAYFNSGTN